MTDFEEGTVLSADEELRAVAERILGHDCVTELLAWYKEITGGDYQFVVFVVRRCYLLMLILAKILGISDGYVCRDEEMSGIKFLTDAASRLQCRYLAAYYREKLSFPKILFVDDILVHGRNLNRLIFDMEHRLYQELEEFDGEEIHAAFVRAIEIKVFARERSNILLREVYERKLSYKNLLSPKEWRELSSNISFLILNADISNASYIFSEHLTEEEFKKLRNNSGFEAFEESTYQGTRQYTKVDFLQKGSAVKAVYTVRIIKTTYLGGYRVLPFIFLPEIGEQELQKLIGRIQMFIPCSNWFDILYEQNGHRSYQELLTLILSHILLLDFNHRFNISRNVDSKDWQEELEKLTRNYAGENWTDTKEKLKSIVSSGLFNIGDLDGYLLEAISEEHFLAKIECVGEKLGDSQKRDLLDWEEAHFWKRGYTAEKQAYEYTKQLYLSGKMRSFQYMISVNNEFKEIFGEYTTREYLWSGVIYFLQLMDAGIVGIVANGPIDKMITGYAQYVKYGEQALLSFTIKLYEYIPMLVLMQRKCSEMDRDINLELEHLSESGLLQQEGLKFELDSIKRYLDCLREMGHRVEDWSGNFYRRKAFAESGETYFSVKWLIDFRELQGRYVDVYTRYLKNKNTREEKRWEI